MELFATYNVVFQTIDLSDVKNLESSVGGYGSLKNTITLDGVSGLQNLIVSEDTSPISIGYAYNSNNYPNREVQIQCKGSDPEKCKNLLKNQLSILSHASNFSLSVDYYQGYDDKGNLVEVWDANGCKKYAYDSGGNLQRKMDENGNTLWARRIYTVTEVTLVTKPKGNTFSIKYR